MNFEFFTTEIFDTISDSELRQIGLSPVSLKSINDCTWLDEMSEINDGEKYLIDLRGSTKKMVNAMEKAYNGAISSVESILKGHFLADFINKLSRPFDEKIKDAKAYKLSSETEFEINASALVMKSGFDAIVSEMKPVIEYLRRLEKTDISKHVFPAEFEKVTKERLDEMRKAFDSVKAKLEKTNVSSRNISTKAIIRDMERMEREKKTLVASIYKKITGKDFDYFATKEDRSEFERVNKAVNDAKGKDGKTVNKVKIEQLHIYSLIELRYHARLFFVSRFTHASNDIGKAFGQIQKHGYNIREGK